MTRHSPSLDTNRLAVSNSIPAAAVLAGDVLVLLAFIGFGLLSHGVEPWLRPTHALRTLTPFLVGWLVVAPIAGGYRRATLTGYFRTIGFVTLAWIGASLLGAAIRSTSYFPGGAPMNFVLVTVAIGFAFLLPWRLCSAAILRRIPRK